MRLSDLVINLDMVTAYQAVVLTIIAISQIYLDFAIISAQRRQARERKLELAKERAAAEMNAHATN